MSGASKFEAEMKAVADRAARAALEGVDLARARSSAVRHTSTAPQIARSRPAFDPRKDSTMTRRPDMDPNDWHASKHACPDGLLKERAWVLAQNSVGDDGPLGPADVVARAKAFHAWLAPPFAVKESSAPFWQADRALYQAIEESRLPMRDRSTKGILAAADRWLAAFADWEAFA